MNILSMSDYDIENTIKLEEIIEKLDGDFITDEEVWKEAREYEEIPCIENIYIRMTYERLKELILEKTKDFDCELEINYEVNCRASWFDINGHFIEDYNGFRFAIKEILTEEGLDDLPW